MLYNLATFGPFYDADTADSLSLVSLYFSIYLVGEWRYSEWRSATVHVAVAFLFYSKSNMTLSKKKKNIEHYIYNKKAFVYMKDV